jgi:two-component system, cell cycle sensor histidine kinase and response regulator CckA
MRSALRIVLIYTVFGFGWILFSDTAVAWFTTDAEQLARIQIFKGWTYVFLTALLLYVLLAHYFAKLEKEVAQHRATARQLRKQTAQTRLFIEHAPAALAIFDRHMRYLAVSRHWREEHHLRDRPVLGACHYDLYPRQPEAWKATHERALRGEIVRCECDRVEGADGTVRWLRWEVRPWFEEDESIGGIAIITENLTAQVEADEARRASEERLRLIAENLREVVWLSENQDLKYLNPAFDRIFGRPAADLISGRCHWSEAVHPEDRAAVQHDIASRQARNEFDCVFRTLRPDGELRWIHARAYPVPGTDETVARVIGVAEDITEKRLLEEQVRHTQKLEAVGTLAGGIAHDFNNILGAIMGFAELARRRLDDRPEVRSHLEDILAGGSRAAALVRKILTFSQRAHSERKAILLGPVVREASDLLRATLLPSIELLCDTSADTAPVLADAGQIHQIVMNLGTNAAHAMRNGPGTLEITLQTRMVLAGETPADPPLTPGTYAHLKVRDYGIGIPPEIRDRIFEPFFTTKGPQEGTGLGLAVVHGIVRDHEGHLALESAPGQGSTFHVYLPSVETEIQLPVFHHDPTPRGSGERILFVDDEEALRRVGRSILLELGYLCEVAADAREARELLEASPRAFDLVITDHAMPGGSGMELAASLREVCPGLPVILVTGHASELDPETLRANDFAHLLYKPLSFETLAKAARHALRPS